MKISEAILDHYLNLRIDYGSRRLVGNDTGDGFKVLSRAHYARRVIVLYIGKDEDAAVAALIGDAETTADDAAAVAHHAMTGE
jgi:hypothetical protein